MVSLLSRRSRLLLLDDDPAMQRLIAALFRRAGHRVDIVSEASKAIERMERSDYQALLLDIMTPTEGGMTVIRYLRENHPTLLKRVVLITGSPRSVLKSVEGDVYAIVQKPFDAPALVQTIERLITK